MTVFSGVFIPGQVERSDVISLPTVLSVWSYIWDNDWQLPNFDTQTIGNGGFPVNYKITFPFFHHMVRTFAELKKFSQVSTQQVGKILKKTSINVKMVSFVFRTFWVSAKYSTVGNNMHHIENILSFMTCWNFVPRFEHIIFCGLVNVFEFSVNHDDRNIF